jgi:hypothetical protein
MAGLRGAAALVAAGMGCLCLTAAAQTPQPAGMVVGAREQAARDSDRVRILQSELTREHAAAAEAAKRRAAHLATSDSKAAEQDQQAQQRATENVAALQRELDAAMRSSSVASAPPARVSVKPAAKPTTSGANAPWWDVYAKPRRAAAAGTSPLTLRATSAAPEATVSNR